MTLMSDITRAVKMYFKRVSEAEVVADGLRAIQKAGTKGYKVGGWQSS